MRVADAVSVGIFVALAVFNFAAVVAPRDSATRIGPAELSALFAGVSVALALAWS